LEDNNRLIIIEQENTNLKEEIEFIKRNHELVCEISKGNNKKLINSKERIKELERQNQKHIEVVADYAIENQQLKQQIQGFEKANHKQAMKIVHYKNTIKQAIQHLETHLNSEIHDSEEDIETFHNGLISWLYGVLEGDF
jgi:chromosome segregation ATPase